MIVPPGQKRQSCSRVALVSVFDPRYAQPRSRKYVFCSGFSTPLPKSTSFAGALQGLINIIWEIKQLFLAGCPGDGVESTKIIVWRLPGTIRSAKIVFWKVWDKVWPGDKALQTAQRLAGGSPQKQSFPLVLQYSGHPGTHAPCQGLGSQSAQLPKPRKRCDWRAGTPRNIVFQ